MRKIFDKDNAKGRGQVRDERKTSHGKGGAPVYTAAYKVNRSDTLLEFLLRKCATSRNNVKSLLARRQVLVNGSVATRYDFPLAKDDEVKLSKQPVREDVNNGNSTARRREPRAHTGKSALQIVYEDDDFIAVNKPVGLLAVESDKDTECAYGYVSAYLSSEGKNARPYVLHRIDKETSGILVFAKDIRVHSMLRLHWNELVQLREYYAVVEGVPEEAEATLVCYLKENKNNLVYVTQDPSGQKAVTHYERLADNGEYALLRVRIDTGRKNQIRAQMQAQGTPIVGDDKYGRKKDGTLVRNPFGRLGLHASKLAFIHPVTKETITLTAAQPSEFRALFSERSKR